MFPAIRKCGLNELLTGRKQNIKDLLDRERSRHLAWRHARSSASSTHPSELIDSRNPLDRRVFCSYLSPCARPTFHLRLPLDFHSLSSYRPPLSRHSLPMPSWSKLTLFVAAAAALSPAVEGHRPLRARPFGRRAPAANKSVIIEMFEWSWDSIAAECTNFIGPAGYGFVQGTSRTRRRHTRRRSRRTLLRHSQPSSGGCPGRLLVDRLPGCLVPAHVQARQPRPVRQHDQDVPQRGGGCHRW